MNKIKRSLSTGFRKHKKLSIFITIVVVIGAYKIASTAGNGQTTTQYTVTPATIGRITQTVSGSGQVTASRQIDLTSQVSGTITSIDVKVGDRVTAGELIATIDNTTAAKNLKSAELSLAQLTEPAKPGDILNAQNSLNKAYSDGLNSVAASFIDLQTVMTGANNLLYDQSGFLGTANSTSLIATAQNYRANAGQAYDKANNLYQKVLAEYHATSGQSATSSIEQLISDTSDVLRAAATALTDIQNTVTYIAATQPNYQTKTLPSTQSNIASWTTTINGDLSSVSGANNSIASASNTLNNLIAGADPLSVQASQLSVNQAQQTYDEYFIRAPFDGVIGRLPVSVYDQAGGSTVIATIIGDKKVANISLDEVDAAKVQVGQNVAVTFDAINGLEATGTVSEVDLVGTVSSGVVAYGVKIDINTADVRIRPGMSVNTVITTEEKDGVLIVPSSAVKTQNGHSYVQVMNEAVVNSLLPARQNRTASSTTLATTTRNVFVGNSGNANNAYAKTGRSMSLTISTDQIPTDVPVTVGLSDDTNTEILSGLSEKEWVVTRTSMGGATNTSSAPSIFSTLGGGNRAGGATTRAVRIGG